MSKQKKGHWISSNTHFKASRVNILLCHGIQTALCNTPMPTAGGPPIIGDEAR